MAIKGHPRSSAPGVLVVSFHFASVLLAVVDSQLSVSSSTTSWSDCKSAVKFVNGHISTMRSLSVVVHVHRELS